MKVLRERGRGRGFNRRGGEVLICKETNFVSFKHDLSLTVFKFKPL
jgi:hypothetical protein